jgi:hypothetical protein
MLASLPSFYIIRAEKDSSGSTISIGKWPLCEKGGACLPLPFPSLQPFVIAALAKNFQSIFRAVLRIYGHGMSGIRLVVAMLTRVRHRKLHLDPFRFGKGEYIVP